jgi:hypothetical protein
MEVFTLNTKELKEEIMQLMKQHEEDNKITYTFREEVLGNGLS